MAWAVVTPSKQELQLDDLPITFLEDTAAKYGVEFWSHLVLWPGKYGRAVYAIYCRACQQFGDTPIPIEEYTPKALLGILKQVEDDLPTTWEDGVPLEDAPTTSGSSGQPEPSDGPPT